MKNITLYLFVFLMAVVAWQGKAQEDCSQEQVSNNFENALYIETGGQEFANDLVVTQNTTNFTLDSIQANIYTQGGVESVDIKFYDDNNGLPGAQIGTTIEDLAPSTEVNVGTAFGDDVAETTFVLPTPMDFSGTGTEDVHYWVQIDVLPNNPDGPPDYYGAALGVTTEGGIGHVGAFNNDDVSDWTAVTSDDYDGVISFYGTCTYVDCPNPEGISVDGVTQNSVDLSWNELGDATEWTVIYGDEGFDPNGTNGTTQDVTGGTPETTITGLSPNMDYEFYVKSTCSPSEDSAWGGPVSVSTGYCDFEGTDSSRYIDDFITTGGETNINNTGSGFSTDGYNDATAMVVSQYAGGTIDFTVNMEGGTFHVGIWVDWNSNMEFEASEQIYDSGSYEDPATGSFDVPAGTDNGDYRLRVANFWIGDPVPCGTTDYGEAEDYTLTVVDPPDCVHPTDVVVTDVTAGTAEVTWTELGTATEWEVIYGPVGFDPEGSNGTSVPDDDNDLGVVLTGLNMETEYDVYVRSVCGADGDSAWAGPANFETTAEVDCSVGPLDSTICYTDNEITEMSYSSTDPNGVLNLTINSGEVENNIDEFIVLDSDGSELYNGYGDGGDLSGLNFQSTGPSITVQVDGDISSSCDSGSQDPIDLTVACATCVNPEANFTVVSDCDNGEQFLIDVEITDMGTAGSLTISDDAGSADQNVTGTETVTFGPFPNGADVVMTVENDDDQNCFITSSALGQDTCPATNNTCDNAIMIDVNDGTLCEAENMTTGTLFGATLQDDIPLNCGGSSTASDVWYKFTASNETHMTALTDDSGNNVPTGVRTAIYSGDDCGDLTEIFCSDDFDGSSPNVVATDLTVGDTYWVRVLGDSSGEDEFDLCVTSPDTPENVECSDIAPFCSPVSSSGDIEPLVFLNTYNFMGETPTGQDGPDYGCVLSQPNPAWFYIKIQNAGDLQFDIIQNTAFDGDGQTIGQTLDVDFVSWGPFTEDELDSGVCDTELTTANLLPVDQTSGGDTGDYDGCDYSADDIEHYGIYGAEEDEIYVIMITNYNELPGYISLFQINHEEQDAGETDCTIVETNQILACEGDEVELETQFPDQIAYVWNKYDPDTDEYVNIPGEDNPTLTVTEGGLYKLESYDDLGELTEENFKVVFSPNPEIDDLDPQYSLCDVPSITLDGTITNTAEFGTVDYQWLDADGEIAGATNPTLEVTETGIYTIEISGTILDINGNESDQVCITSFDVEVTDSNFDVSLGDDQIFCDQDAYELTAEITDGNPNDATFEWEGPEGPIAETTQTISVSETGTYTVFVDIDGCEGEASVDLEFNNSPEFDLGDDIVTCSLNELILDATPSNYEVGEVTFEWNYNGNPIAENGPMVNAADYGYGTYTVTIYGDDPDCDAEDSITIEQRDDIGVDLTADTELTKEFKYCENDGEVPSYEVTLTATPNNASEDEVNFTWFRNGNELTDANGSTYTTTYDSEGDYNDEYTVEVSLGSCMATSSLTTSILIEPYDHPCKITEGLSPGNRDGVNDCLDLTYIDDRSGIANFKVYNRYGVKVYEKGNYVNQWCGQDDDGDDLITGTYYYILEMKNEDPIFGKSKRGWIYINRKIN